MMKIYRLIYAFCLLHSCHGSTTSWWSSTTTEPDSTAQSTITPSTTSWWSTTTWWSSTAHSTPSWWSTTTWWSSTAQSTQSWWSTTTWWSSTAQSTQSWWSTTTWWSPTAQATTNDSGGITWWSSTIYGSPSEENQTTTTPWWEFTTTIAWSWITTTTTSWWSSTATSSTNGGHTTSWWSSTPQSHSTQTTATTPPSWPSTATGWWSTATSWWPSNTTLSTPSTTTALWSTTRAPTTNQSTHGWNFTTSSVLNTSTTTNPGILPPPANVSIKSIHILPTLSYREQLDETTSGAITYTPYIVFKCHFILDGSFFYFIDWYVNGVAYKTFGPSRNLDELVLTDTYLENDKISPGIDIYCGVRVASDETGRATPSFNSTVFFAGLKIVGNRTSLSQDTEASVRLMSTVPIGCKYNSHAPNTDCFLDLQIYDPAGYKCNQGNIVQLKVMPDSQFCGQKIKGLKRGDFWNISAIYEVKIQTVDETRNDKSRYSLHMLTATDFGHRWFSNYKLGAVDVDVLKDNTYSRVCYSHVDPHMKTADGQYYENQEDGEYLLYKNVKYGIEVQEKYKRCNNNYALCTCGIAIKAGADVFMINTCGTAVFTGFVSCRDGGILKIVNQGTRQFYVYTPIGTWIDIYMHGSSYINTMNVDIYMAPKDKKQTEGLCGYFDGNNANDFRTRNGTTISASSYPYAFTRSWRLKDDENLFKTVRSPLRKWSETNGMYCVCDPPSTRNTSRGVCAETQYMRCPRYEATTQKYCRFSGNRKKRSTVMKEERELLRLLALTKQSKEVHDLKKRSEMSVNGSSIDVEVARRHCTAAINGSVAVSNNAESLGGESPDEVINQCMFDVQAGDDLSLAQVHIDSLNGLVEKELAKDPEYVANNADKVQTFIKNSCPSNCSGQGVCSDEGTCICSKYTHGSDCSIDERVALIIDDIEGGGLCNLTDGDGCTCFYVRTMNLLQNFSCQINTKVGLTDGTILGKTPVHLSGEYDDMFTGVCCVQASEDPSRERRSVAESLLFWKKYDIAISNDGTNFGSPVSMIVFNSVCQEVLDLGEVTLKDDFCFIDGTCVASYGSHISDECYQCEPSTNKYAWTQVCNPEKPQNQTAVIIGVVVGSVLAVALIISGMVIWKLKIQPRIKKTRSVNVSQQFHSENMN